MHRERHHFSKMRNEENVEQQDKTRQDKKSNSFKFLFESKAQETIAYSFTSHSNNKKAKKRRRPNKSTTISTDYMKVWLVVIMTRFTLDR